MNATSYTLEHQIQFFCAQRTEAYLKYGEGAAQRKIGYGAKSSFKVLALLGLERSGA